MLDLTSPLAPPLTTRHHSRLTWTIADTIAIARRNVIGMLRTPQVLAFATIMPVIFVLIFRYVFGGSIHIPGVSYVDYLVAGIMVQTVAFSSQYTAVGLADDLHKGLIERFRSLAMARSAVLAGRAMADGLRYSLTCVVVAGVGYGVGFRVHTNFLGLVAAAAVVVVFGLAMSWVMALLALSMRSAEAAVGASFPLLAVLIFPSNIYVSPSTMPQPLMTYAQHQPVSVTATAVRALLLGGPAQSQVLAALAWSLGMIVVFGSLAVLRYRRAG
jgi:ABC-2 type transport system permease protein/oleandomycin transport system permease protein